jgi:hypothetical protein
MAKRQIFLSYLRVNVVRVLNLYDRLLGAGFKPWMDVKDLQPGEDWKVATEKAIRNSDFFLACLTKSSFESEGFFKQEVEWARDNLKKRHKNDIYLIPVKLEACEVPDSLRQFNWLDLYKQDGWNRLLKVLNPSRVTLIEFEMEGTLEYFNEEEFKMFLRDIVGVDIKRVRITGIRPGSIKVTVKGVGDDDEELTRIVELLRGSKEIRHKFSAKTRLESIVYIQEGRPHTLPVRRRLMEPAIGVIVGLVSGILGNLLADLIRQGWFSNPFTSPQVVVPVLMTLAGLYTGIRVARRPLSLPKLSRFWPEHRRLGNVVAFLLLATPVAAGLSMGLREVLIRIRGCGEVEVEALELDLPAGRQKFFEREITLRRLDLYNRQNLAGRVVLSKLPDRGQCLCEWWVKTDLLPRQQLSTPNEAKDCIFSIPFQDGVTEINLTLNVGRRVGASGFEKDKYFRFKIKVQP